MRVGIALMIGLLLLTSTAFAQEHFPSVRVANDVIDSVVSIEANRVAFRSVSGGGPFESSRTQRLTTSTMTGFIYTENGYIITDSTNIEGAEILNVVFHDGTELEAEVIGLDEEYGIGILKVEPEEPLKAVTVVEERYNPEMDVYPYEQGDPVIAIGSSAGYGGTVTFGIISAIRNFRNRNLLLIPHVIQSDATVNAGNEGCPLFDAKGRVIGMHDQRGGGGSMQQTTFFTPIWVIKRVADEIIEKYELGVPQEDMNIWHPWLGVKPFSGTTSPIDGRLREFGDDLKMYLDMPDQYWDVGVCVDQVWQESPANEFGIRDRDILISVAVLDADENEKVPFQYIRNWEQLELLVTTAERDDIFIFGVLRIPNYLTLEVVIGQHPGSFAFVGAEGDYLEAQVSQDYF